MAGRYEVDEGAVASFIVKILAWALGVFVLGVGASISLAILIEHSLEWSFWPAFGLALLPGMLLGLILPFLLIAAGTALGLIKERKAEKPLKGRGSFSFDIEKHYKPVLVSIIVLFALVLSSIYFLETGNFAPVAVTLVGAAATALIGGRKTKSEG